MDTHYNWIDKQIDKAVNTMTRSPTVEPTMSPTDGPTVEPSANPTIEPTQAESKRGGPDLDSIGFIFLWIFCGMVGLCSIAACAVCCDYYDRKSRSGHSALPTSYEDDNL